MQYSIIFQKKFVPILVLFDLGNEVNAIYPTFTWELGLPLGQQMLKHKKS